MLSLIRQTGIALACTLLTLLTAPSSFAQEPSLAERAPDEHPKIRLMDTIKERWKKKQRELAAHEPKSTKITEPGDHTFSFDHNGHARKYLIHVPKQYDPAKATPLLMALHGGGGDMDNMASDKVYKLISKSDQEGFIAVFPNGYSKRKSGILATWNAGNCCGDARDEKVDDVGFIKEVVQRVSQQTNVDSSRIFAVGMSNGGMMSYRLACELTDTFKAIASVTGTDNTAACSPKHPISILHIHAKDDDHVLFSGGIGPNAWNKSKVTEFTSVPATIEKWVKSNGCKATPKRTVEKPGAYCDVYSECRDNTQVQLCVTDSGGHSWPGGEKNRRRASNPSQALSATDVIWEFFKNK